MSLEANVSVLSNTILNGECNHTHHYLLTYYMEQSPS